MLSRRGRVTCYPRAAPCRSGTAQTSPQRPPPSTWPMLPQGANITCYPPGARVTCYSQAGVPHVTLSRLRRTSCAVVLRRTCLELPDVVYRHTHDQRARELTNSRKSDPALLPRCACRGQPSASFLFCIRFRRTHGGANPTLTINKATASRDSRQKAGSRSIQYCRSRSAGSQEVLEHSF